MIFTYGTALAYGFTLYVHLEPHFKEEVETFLTGITPSREEFITCWEMRWRSWTRVHRKQRSNPSWMTCAG